jgi:predicted PurR-regulated permease PerM
LPALLTSAGVIAGLYFGRDVFIPIFLALLLSFLLTYPVSWLEKLRLGRVAAVIIVLALAFSTAGALLWMGTGQLSAIIVGLPEYQHNIQRKLDALRNPGSFGMARAVGNLKQMVIALSPNTAAGEANLQREKQVHPHSPAAKLSARRTTKSAPIPVEVVKPQPSILQALGLISTSTVHTLLGAGAVVILTLFILIRRSDLRARLFRLLGPSQLNTMTAAIDEAAERVSRYLFTQSSVNSGYGLLFGLGLYWIGVPYAPFWGSITAVLRFIPYVGVLIVGTCPFLLSLAVFDDWKRPLFTLGLFVLIEALVSGIIEPWIFATRTGISSLAILVSATFWTVLWGPIGLVISTPMTVCLFVLGRYFPPLEFLYIVLGDEPVLPPSACYYQRLLAFDEQEARDIADGFLKGRTPDELYESVLIPALLLAKRDRQRKVLDEEREKVIYQTTRDLIEDIGDTIAEYLETTEGTPRPEQLPLPLILCIPARDKADELIGIMLAQLLRRDGHNAEAVPPRSIEEIVTIVAERQPDVLCITALSPFAMSSVRSVCRKASQRRPGIKIVLCLWHSTTEIQDIQNRLGSACPASIVHNLAEAERQLQLSEDSSDKTDEPAALM